MPEQSDTLLISSIQSLRKELQRLLIEYDLTRQIHDEEETTIVTFTEQNQTVVLEYRIPAEIFKKLNVR